MDSIEEKKMNIKDEENDERDFSIELISNKHWHSSSAYNANDSVLIEGTLGKLQNASFVEPEILEVKGSYGVLRLYLRKNEIKVIDTVKKYVGGDN